MSPTLKHMEIEESINRQVRIMCKIMCPNHIGSKLLLQAMDDSSFRSVKNSATIGFKAY